MVITYKVNGVHKLANSLLASLLYPTGAGHSIIVSPLADFIAQAVHSGGSLCFQFSNLTREKFEHSTQPHLRYSRGHAESL